MADTANNGKQASAGENPALADPAPMLRGEHRFSPSVCSYLEQHAVDLELAYALGVRSDRDTLLYTYTTPKGETYARRRDLADPDKRTVQPKGEPLILYWPAGRPGPGAEVLLTEGEPDALAALSARDEDSNLAVAALPGTATPVERITAELASASTVYLALDGDKAGRDAADRIARALQNFTTIRIVKLGDGEDVASRLAGEEDRAGWLRDAIATAAEAPKLSTKAEPSGYGRHKKADKLRDLRAKGIDPDRSIGALLGDVSGLIRRFVVVDEAQTTVIALWVAHAHAVAAADTTPYLAVTSAEKRSGKSRLLEVLAQLVPHPIEAANISEAALFRALAGETTSTLLFDEIDGTFGPKARDKEDLRSLINAGYRRGAKAYRCVGEGAKQSVVAFEVYGPKCLAGIGELPETIADRSIPIRLRRRNRSEPVARGRYRTIAAAAAPIRETLEVWADKAADELRRADPELPDELDDRAQDGAEPLLALADLAADEWPQKARAALVELHAGKADDGDSWGVQLLVGIREAMGDEDRLPTAELLERLKSDPEAPWATWGEHGLAPRGLARLLKPYGIKSKAIRVGDETPRGYLREHFEDVWDRYLAPDSPAKCNKRNNGSNKPETPLSEAQHADPLLHLEYGHKPHGEANVADVALEHPDREPGPHGAGTGARPSKQDVEKLAAERGLELRPHPKRTKGGVGPVWQLVNTAGNPLANPANLREAEELLREWFADREAASHA